MKARRAEMGPKARARLIGMLYLLTIVGGGLAQGLIAGSIIVAGDAAATAHHIVAHAPMYRLGFAIYLIEMSCQIAMTVLFYYLLEPAGRTASALAAVFGLVGCTIKTLARLFFFAPLLVLGGAGYLGAFDPKQLEAAALFSLRMNYTVETIAMVFFGLNTLVTGYLVLKSTFLPRALGVISVVGGLGWLIYLYEPLAARLEAGIVGIGVLGAFATVLWLLVKGVDEPRWREQANANPEAVA